ncbi:MAG: NmrA/HSCARG family protein [Burkholderiales bacterium]
MADKKIIAVVGATGNQGGGLVRAILADSSGAFAVRALTRDPESEKAQELAKLGAEVVQADLDSGPTLRAAFDGAYGAFCLTFYWEHFVPEKELVQAAAMAQAAQQAGLRHVVWSTLEDTRKLVPLTDDRMPTLLEKYKVPHFDAKAEANRAFAQYGVQVTYMLTSFYWESLIYLGMGPKKGADGKLELTLPMGDKRLAGIAAEDIGKCAFCIFKAGFDLLGKTVAFAGDHLTGAQMAAALSKELGQTVSYNPLSPEQFRQLGTPGADELGNMFQYMQDFESEFCAARNLDSARAINPSLQTFGGWLGRNKDRIPLT